MLRKQSEALALKSLTNKLEELVYNVSCLRKALKSLTNKLEELVYNVSCLR